MINDCHFEYMNTDVYNSKLCGQIYYHHVCSLGGLTETFTMLSETQECESSLLSSGIDVILL